MEKFDYIFPERIISNGYYNREFPYIINLNQKYFVFISQRMIMIINKETNNMICKQQLKFKVTDIQILQENPLKLFCVTQRTAYIFSFQVFEELQTAKINTDWFYESQPLKGIIKETKNLLWTGKVFDNYVIFGYTNNVFAIIDKDKKQFIALLQGQCLLPQQLQQLIDKTCACQEVIKNYKRYQCHFCNKCQQNIINKQIQLIKDYPSYDSQYNIIDLLAQLYQIQNQYYYQDETINYGIVQIYIEQQNVKIIISGHVDHILIYQINLQDLQNANFINIYPSQIIQLNLINQFLINNYENNQEKYHQQTIQQNNNMLNSYVQQIQFLDFNNILVLTLDSLFNIELQKQQKLPNQQQILQILQDCKTKQYPLTELNKCMQNYTTKYKSQLICLSELTQLGDIYTLCYQDPYIIYQFYFNRAEKLIGMQTGYKQIIFLKYEQRKNEYQFINTNKVLQLEQFKITKNKPSLLFSFFKDDENFYASDKDGIYIFKIK